MGDFRRVKPISRAWGFDRGVPVDRYYIETFLSKWASDVKGQVLEIGDNEYTRRYGGNLVTKSDILHVETGLPKVTLVGDLADAPHIPSDSFDCIICTQTLQLIVDVSAAMRTLYRLLRPGAILLATVPGISRIAHGEGVVGDYWRFTAASVRRLLENACPRGSLDVEVYGNVLAAAAFLYGLAAEELDEEELNYCDSDFETLIAFRLVKAS